MGTRPSSASWTHFPILLCTRTSSPLEHFLLSRKTSHGSGSLECFWAWVSSWHKLLSNQNWMLNLVSAWIRIFLRKFSYFQGRWNYRHRGSHVSTGKINKIFAKILCNQNQFESISSWSKTIATSLLSTFITLLCSRRFTWCCLCSVMINLMIELRMRKSAAYHAELQSISKLGSVQILRHKLGVRPC